MEVLYPLDTHAAVPSAGEQKTVTVLIKRTIGLEEEDGFLQTLQSLLEQFARFPGTSGSKVFRHPQGDNIEFSIVKQFHSEADHIAWMQTPALVQWQEQIAPPSPATESCHAYSGLESLFVPVKTAGATPRWKMTIILIFAVYPMSLALSHWFAPTLARLPLFSGTLLTSVVMVVLMTYVMVPLLTKIFQRWL